MIWILPLGLLSGLFGRMGGAAKSNKWYDFLINTKARDVGCSIIYTLCLWLKFGMFLKFWWVYVIVFGLTWGALATYWDFLFKFDNLWFSGFVVGLCALPALFIISGFWWYLALRSIALAVIWGTLNTVKYDKIILWRRDVSEEFLRYASIVI